METIVILKLFMTTFPAWAQHFCKLGKLYKIKEIMNSIPKKQGSKVAFWPLPVSGSIDGFRDRQTFEPRVEEFWKQRWSHNWNTAWNNQPLSQGRGRGRAAEEILNFKLYTHTIRWSWWSPRGRYSEQVWHPMSSLPHIPPITYYGPPCFTCGSKLVNFTPWTKMLSFYSDPVFQ